MFRTHTLYWRKESLLIPVLEKWVIFFLFFSFVVLINHLGLDPVCPLGCAQVQSHANWRVKPEAVMEPLQQQAAQPGPPQPQNLAPLGMDAREKQGQQMREAQFLYAQKLVTQTLLSATPGRPSGSSSLGPLVRVPPATAVTQVFEGNSANSEPEEEEGGLEDDNGDDDIAEVAEKEAQAASKYSQGQKVACQDPRAAPISGLLPAPGLPPHGQQAQEDHTKDATKAPPAVSTAGQPGWNQDEQLKQVSLSHVGVIHLFFLKASQRGLWAARTKVCDSVCLVTLLQ